MITCTYEDGLMAIAGSPATLSAEALGKAEHYGVALIATQGVRERRRRLDTGSAKYHLTVLEAPHLCRDALAIRLLVQEVDRLFKRGR